MPDPLPVSTDVLPIDEQIEQCQDEKELIELKRRRNELIPISRLPVFLLTSIFLLFPAIRKEDDDLYWELEDEDIYYPTWLSITHVCHLWREAAIEYPLMWTNIILDSPEWTHIMLQRSKSAPLVIHQKPRRQQALDDHIIQLLLPHLHHVQKLIMDITPSILTRIISRILQGPHVPLEFEQIALSNCSIQRCEPIPDGLFERCLRLQRLSLMNCNISWTGRSFCHDLTHLHLGISHDHPRPMLEDILAILRRVGPSLTDLRLTMALPAVHDSDTQVPSPLPHLDTVQLPSLRLIFLTDFSMNCANLMQYLAIARHATIGFQCRHYPASAPIEESINALFRPINPRYDLRNTEDGSLSTAVSWDMDKSLDKFRLSVGITADEPNSSARALSDETVLVMRLPQALNDDASCTNVLLQSLLAVRLDIATSLSVSGRFEVGRDVWQTLFYQMRHIKTLELKGRMSYALVNALNNFTAVPSSADLDDENAVSSTLTVPLPNLTTLRIHNAHLAFPLGPLSLCTQLTEFLTKRNALLSATAPKILTFHNCHVTDGQLQQLVAAGGVHAASSGQPYTWGVGGIGLIGQEDD